MRERVRFFSVFLVLLAFEANLVAQGGPTQGESQPLNNDAIVKLVKAGLREETIISIVRTQPGKYSLGADDIIALKRAGVSEKTIASMAAAANKGAASAPSTSLAPTSIGCIKGTLTFLFNYNYGTRPDVGAQVVLVHGSLDPSPDDATVLVNSFQLVVLGKENRTYVAVAHAVADGSGHFELTDVPPGQYTIVIQSSHAKGMYTQVVVTTDKKGRPLKKPRTEQRLTKRDILGVIYSTYVTIEPGKTEDVSHDFGISALPGM